MSSAPLPSPGEPDWKGAVTVREDPELARELTARMRAPGTPRRLSVTDLLSPRPAFWRATVGPTPLPPEREAYVESGRRLHRILGLVFAPEGQLEVRVHGAQVQGRVDVLTDRPLEIKTTSYPPPSSDPISERPEHVDQVGMYSALLGIEQARLVYLQTEGDELRGSATYDLEFDALDPIRTGMEERAQALSAACGTRSAEGLPRCAWYDRGCEYRGAGVCDCTGDEARAGPLCPPTGAHTTARPELSRRLEEAVRARLGPPGPATIHRFRDLLYPRRAYFEGLSTLPPEPAVGFDGETDTYSRLIEAVDSGPVREATRLPTLSDEPDEEVGGFRGTPVFVRTSRATRRLDPQTVVERSPQYALQLGFRCVATGTDHGRLVLGYDRASEKDRIQVLEYWFDPSSTFSRVWRARSRAIDAARAHADPGSLGPCPGWMFDGCAYRERCGCGSPGGLSQR
ncbi:MAG: hypothetical protein L3K10_06900 [Thermoplasmata archaeon]|nr:hypothetical protein [Thermoplasmata archaeon]